MTTSTITKYQKTTRFVLDMDTILTFGIYETAHPDAQLTGCIVANATYWPAFALATYLHPGYTLLALTLPFVVKAAFRRQRPFVQCQELPYRGSGTIYPGSDRFSFPSGHAWMAAAVAFRLLPTWAVVVAGAPWVAFIAYIRTLNGSHFLGDVLAGVLCGFLQSRGVVHPSNEWPLAVLSTALWLYTLKTHGFLVARPPAREPGSGCNPVQ